MSEDAIVRAQGNIRELHVLGKIGSGLEAGPDGPNFEVTPDATRVGRRDYRPIDVENIELAVDSAVGLAQRRQERMDSVVLVLDTNVSHDFETGPEPDLPLTHQEIRFHARKSPMCLRLEGGRSRDLHRSPANRDHGDRRQTEAQELDDNGPRRHSEEEASAEMGWKEDHVWSLVVVRRLA